MGRFLEAVTPDEARRILGRFGPIVRIETAPLAAALGRVASVELVAPEPMPAFARSQMDGWAVRASDTFGASETAPAYLAFEGRVPMGAPPPAPHQPGHAMEVSTGGALPDGADAVVMLEYCREVGVGQVEVGRAVVAGENVLAPGGDLQAGALLLQRGTRLAPQHLLALGAFGVGKVEVFARPRIAVISTGDEIVPVSGAPRPGQVRDANAAAIAAQVVEAGGDPVMWGIVRDDPAALRAAIVSALEGCDAVFVSGGSSQGARDSSAEVLASLGPPGLLAHGIAVAPGKPTILAAVGEKPVIGLPGHPVSSLVIVRLFMNPMLRALGGEAGRLEPFPCRTRARLARSVASKPGREDWVRVALHDGTAEPLLKGSGAVSTALLADGLVRIDLDSEGLAAGAEVEVMSW